MATKRMIHYKIWEDENFAKLSSNAKLLFIGMITHADDDGRGKASPMYLKAKVFMYEEISVTKMLQLRNELETAFKNIKIYQVDENEYYEFSNWTKFQYIRKDTYQKSDIIGFDDVSNDCVTPPLHESIENVTPNTKSNTKSNTKIYMRDEEFETIWEAYPNKSGNKKQSLNKFIKAKHKKEILPSILEAIKLQKENPKFEGYSMPMSSTWINGERWNDEVLNSTPTRKKLTEKQIQDSIKNQPSILNQIQNA